jgi:hypothetical protein
LIGTTTVLLVDLDAGNVPRICIKTGLPADVTGRFAFGYPSRFSWVSGTIGCAVLIVLGLPVTVLLVPLLSLGAFVARHSQGVITLPMTQRARRRLWLGRWGGWILLAVSTGALSAILWIGTQSTVLAGSETGVAMQAWTIMLAVCLLIWLIAASWAVLVTSAYLQPGGGVPLVGIEGLRRHDPVVGSYIEFRRVHQRFAEAVEAQYRNVSAARSEIETTA